MASSNRPPFRYLTSLNQEWLLNPMHLTVPITVDFLTILSILAFCRKSGFSDLQKVTQLLFPYKGGFIYRLLNQVVTMCSTRSLLSAFEVAKSRPASKIRSLNPHHSVYSIAYFSIVCIIPNPIPGKKRGTSR